MKRNSMRGTYWMNITVDSTGMDLFENEACRRDGVERIVL
jgi:hypothetical protein